MKRLALFTVAFGLAFSAAAQTPVADAAPAAQQATAMTDAHAVAAETHAAKDKLADRKCLKETGSRVIRSDRKCALAAGHAYTREDLDRTGEVDLADALRKLDPAIR